MRVGGPSRPRLPRHVASGRFCFGCGGGVVIVGDGHQDLVVAASFSLLPIIFVFRRSRREQTAMGGSGLCTAATAAAIPPPPPPPPPPPRTRFCYYSLLDIYFRKQNFFDLFHLFNP